MLYMKQFLILGIALLAMTIAPQTTFAFEPLPVVVESIQVKIYKFETRHNQDQLIEIFKEDNDVLHWICEGYTIYVYTNTNVADAQISSMLSSRNVNFNFLGSTTANRDSKRFKK